MQTTEKRHIKSIMAAALALVLVVSPIGIFAANSENNNEIKPETSVLQNDEGYSAYLEKNSSAEFSPDKIIIAAGAVKNIETPSAVKTVDGVKAVEVSRDNKNAEFSFNVENSGLFNIQLTYKAIEETGMDIRLSMEFDGGTPYEELNDISFSRIWENAEGGIKTDKSGDQVRPEQKEKFRFNSRWAENSLGLYNSPYSVYLEKGTHTIKIGRVAEAVLISQITLAECGADIPNYGTYLENNSDAAKAAESCTIDAENAFEKSDSTLAPTTDSTNPGMSPSNAVNQVINSFGKDYWKENGQWASWTVPDGVSDGLYVLRFRAKQAGNVGTPTFRKLYINGEIPFKGAESVRFNYVDGWQISTFQDDEPYLIRLKARDTITLEATTGPLAESLNKIYSSIDMLNNIYQSIIMVTSPTPDSVRDYNIQKEIPTLIEDFTNARDLIASVGEGISSVIGEQNSKVFFISKFVNMLDGFVNDYRTIVPQLENFKSYIDSYAGQTYEFNALPLELDSILLMSPDSKAPKAEVGFGKYMKFQCKRFLTSFTGSYTAEKSDKTESKIVVWTSSGRDQAQSMMQIIENDFTPQTGIKVDFKIATTGMANAILSGKEPDINLTTTAESVIDLAMRGQVLELNDYINGLSDEYMSQFTEDIWNGFTYKNNIYALPITQDFSVMFYRTDIFEKLGLTVPNTWDEFYKVLRKLQRNNFQIGIQESNSATPGISAGITFYESLLYQNGEEYYKDNLRKVNFESTGGKKAFLDWVNLSKNYGLDTDFDAPSRFRSGEMPLIITNFSFFNTISTVAPEILSRWKMAPIPATVNKDGSLNRASSSTVTCTMILKSAKKRGRADDAFEFIKWWAGSDAQIKYSNVMVSLQGLAGRPSTANIKAFEKLGWDDDDLALITEQRKYTRVKPQVPGVYIVSRYLTNALRTSYGGDPDPLRQLSVQCRKINVELQRKYAEFEKNNEGGN